MTVIFFNGQYSMVYGFYQTKQNEIPKILEVKFCDILKNPDIYDQKTIRVKAILVANIEPVVDGGDSFVYSTKCHHGPLVKLTYTFVDPPTSELGVKLRKYFFASKNGSTGKAEVVLVGEFQIAKDFGFGHLSAFKYQIALTRIEKVRPVKKKDW